MSAMHWNAHLNWRNGSRVHYVKMTAASFCHVSTQKEWLKKQLKVSCESVRWQKANKELRTFSFWDLGKMAVTLEASQLCSIPELSEQSHADFSSLIPLQWHRSPGIGYWILHLSLTLALTLSHSLTSGAVFHVDHNGTQHSTIHDPSPCAPLKSHPHGHCIGTWSPDCWLTASFHAALPRHHKISTVRLSLSLA